MPHENIFARATLRICHERRHDYDAVRGLWLYRRVDDDDEYRNILTNAGRVVIHTYIYGVSDQRSGLGAGLNFIALSNDDATPVAADTELPGELAEGGLGRVQGTVSLPSDAGTTTQIQALFTYSGDDAQGVQKTALFDSGFAGNMAHEILFTQRTLETNDTLRLTFSIVVT